MRRRTFSWGAALALALTCGGCATVPFGARPRAEVASAEDDAVSLAGLTQALLAETNRVRRDHGRHPLRPQAELNAAAGDQASYMALRLRMTHDNVLAGEGDARDRAQRHHYAAATIAENVADLYIPPEEAPLTNARLAHRLVVSWMNSPGHRTNLLNRDFTNFGCAARLAKDLGQGQRLFGVQVFSTEPTETDLP